MKQFLMLGAVLMVGACALMQGKPTGTNTTATNVTATQTTPAVPTSAADVSNMMKLKTCSLEQATAKIQDGTAFSKTLNENAQDIAGTCLKKLALGSSGLDTQANQDAMSALQSLMNAVQK